MPNQFKLLPALLKRELLEHNNLRRVPVILLCIALLLRLAIYMGTPSPDLGFVEQLQLDKVVDNILSSAMARSLYSMNFIIMIAMYITAVFYSLSCLFNERQDQSVLFWRSLPISDSLTVASKLIIALLVIPLTILLCQIITTVIFLDVNSIDYFANYFFASLKYLSKIVVWSMLPVVAWCLFCSGFAERNPFLLAFVAPIIVILVDNLFFAGQLSAALITDRFTGNDHYSFSSLVIALVFSAICIILVTIKRSQRI